MNSNPTVPTTDTDVRDYFRHCANGRRFQRLTRSNCDDPAGTNHERPSEFETRFDALARHVTDADSDIVVLPELRFSRWLPSHDPTARDVDAAWEAAVTSHAEWLERLQTLEPATVVGSSPVVSDGRLNKGFVRTADGTEGVHEKSHLPDEPGFREAPWYETGNGSFEPTTCAGLAVGFLVCTEMWASHEVRADGRAGVDLLVNPRVTEQQTVEEWLAGARTMGMLAGSYLASSNRTGSTDGGTFGGSGWVTSPDGTVLARTDSDHPFATVEVDPTVAGTAKETYPRDALGRVDDRS